MATSLSVSYGWESLMPNELGLQMRHGHLTLSLLWLGMSDAK